MKKKPAPEPEPPSIPIREIRGQRVLLDSDLAAIYGVPTFRFNEAIKRNLRRFPADFMFRLTKNETDALRSQNVILESGGFTASAEEVANFAMSDPRGDLPEPNLI